jgi:hypothetical protein
MSFRAWLSLKRTALIEQAKYELSANIVTTKDEARTGWRLAHFSPEAITMKKHTSSNMEAVDVTAFNLRYDPISLKTALVEVDVNIQGYFYVVDFGLGVNPRHHRVGINATCSCYLGELCPAVDVVRAYLADGGDRAPEPPPGFYPVIPSKCPICQAEVTFDIQLSTAHRGAGWRCEASGSAHYWQRMVQATAWKFACKQASLLGLPSPERLPIDLW